MQFEEPKNQVGKCPICGRDMVIRTTKGSPTHCGRPACRYARRYYTSRYQNAFSGPMDRPASVSDVIKLTP